MAANYQSTRGNSQASPSVFTGILLITLATLTLEITLTRVFSSVLWYHFAFLAVSVALFGAGAAGQFVYLARPRFQGIRILTLLQGAATAFSLSVPISFILFTKQKFLIDWVAIPGLKEILRWSLTYLVFTLPFFFSGICISLALTYFKRDVSRVYFFDLTGAGLGCILVTPLLSLFGGAGTIQASSVLAAFGALSFSLRSWGLRTWVAGALVTLLAALVPVFSTLDIPVMVEGKAVEGPKVSERWNSFSKVTVHAAWKGRPGLWGVGRNVGQLPTVETMNISIDAYAGTPMMRFDGDFKKMDFLKNDISSVAYYLMKSKGSALIIGAGGGRDIITALMFDAARVYAVEINPIIIDFVQNEFGDFTDRVYNYPGVEAIVDEGRSYIAKFDDRVDIIQASMVDTAAASSAGAFSLTENNLYTVEAFEEYYEHLSEDGILTITRGYPAEALRLFGIAKIAWGRLGAEDPADHIMVLHSGPPNRFPLANVLVKRSPFEPEEIAKLEEKATEIGFSIPYKPGGGSDSRFQEVALAEDLDDYARGFPVDISPTTDDSPFFFNFVRMKDVIFGEKTYLLLSIADKAMLVLLRLLALVTVLAAVFIIGPLFIRKRLPLTPGKTVPFLFYFTCLGLGFILIELPMMHRFILFLGHPVHALSVILFAILIFGGLGSLSTQRIAPTMEIPALRRTLLLLLLVIVVSIAFLPPLLRAFVGEPTALKIIASVILLAPLGFLMGRPFPLGLRVVHRTATELVPWVWGVNGAASVLGTVVAIVLAINLGFSLALCVGLAFYGCAWATLVISKGFNVLSK
jgi:hypothetical protein